MKKQSLLKIERKLKARAKKMRLGKKRTGAYVYGTLRKLKGNPSESLPNFKAFLTERLIPDLRESGYEFTADDFDTIVYYLRFGKDRQYRQFRNYIMETLVPDLKKSGRVYTARDFVRGIKFIDKGRSLEGKIKKNSATPQVDPPWNYGIYTGGGRVARRIPTKIERLRKIVSERQNAVIDGKRVDLYSASAIVSVYDKLNPENRVKFAKMPVGKMADVAFRIITTREVVKNPINDVLEVLSRDEIVKEYRKGGEGQGSKLMFTSRPMTGSSAAQLVRKIGNYNNFSWRRVMPFLGKLDYATAALPLPLEFRVGREYSPTIYIENVEMPRYANQIIEYARERLKVDEASYSPVARRIRLWWD